MSRCFIETSWASHNHAEEELCGDKVESVVMEDGGQLLVLSDGLGSGVKANILASLTCKIISSMVLAGAALSDVVETVASTLPICKEREVAYSTFTLLQVHPDGIASFVEFDNPSLVWLRNGQTKAVPWQTQQIAGRSIRIASVRLELGDFLVAFSDGVTHAGVGQAYSFGWERDAIVDFLEQSYRPQDRASDVQKRLLAEAYRIYNGICGDDTSVAVVHLLAPAACTVMVGPPMDEANDAAVVQKLMQSDGYRVVCGGTTSQIVAKVTGQESRIRLDTITPDVPPAADMEGVDLVTEGVITIGKTLELADNYWQQGMPESFFQKPVNAAELLAELLCVRATSVHFMMGRAVNRAHKTEHKDISLSIKLRTIRDLTDLLRQMGKQVSMEYD